MIENERQYLITKAQVARFVRTLEGLSQQVGVHPLVLKAQKEAVRSQISDLEADLREYELLKARLKA